MLLLHLSKKTRLTNSLQVATDMVNGISIIPGNKGRDVC